MGSMKWCEGLAFPLAIKKNGKHTICQFLDMPLFLVSKVLSNQPR
jgi:hypothetical protein